MAGWITAFKVIPWADLIAAAPTVAKGARKLWASVRKQEAEPAAGSGPEARLHALEAQIDELRKELTASSELVTALAEQNSRLVEGINILRVRTRVLLLMCAVTTVALIGLGVAIALN